MTGQSEHNTVLQQLRFNQKFTKNVKGLNIRFNFFQGQAPDPHVWRHRPNFSLPVTFAYEALEGKNELAGANRIQR